MSTLTVHLPAPLAERLAREAGRRHVSSDVIVQEALERAIPVGNDAKKTGLFERLSTLMVVDPDCPTDLATNPLHLEDLGGSRSA